MLRLRIPLLITDVDEMNISPKDDDDQMMGRMKSETEMTMTKGGISKSKNKLMGKAGRPILADIDWEGYTDYFKNTSRETLVNSIAGVLLQTKTAVGPQLLKEYADESSRENFIRSVTMQIMSTPEYQLC
jgi:hypothetical protein